MLWFLLGLGFIIGFGIIAWRIMLRRTAPATKVDAAYVCHLCNEHHCECHRKNDP